MSDIKKDEYTIDYPTKKFVEYRKLLVAWTPTVYEGSYPPFVNVMQVGSGVEITIRGPVKKDGTVGDTIMMEVNNWTCDWIGRVLREASDKFECGVQGKWVLDDQLGTS